MLDLNKNPDFTWFDSGKIESEYYDLDGEFNMKELWNKNAIDQMIEMVLVTEPQERLFNLAFGSPLYVALFENFNRLDTIMDKVFDVIEIWVPITIDRGNAQIEKDEDAHSLTFRIPYVSNNGMVAGVFGRRIRK